MKSHDPQAGYAAGGATSPQQHHQNSSTSSAATDLLPNLAMEVKSSIFGDRDNAVDHDPVSGVHTNLLLDVDQVLRMI